MAKKKADEQTQLAPTRDRALQLAKSKGTPLLTSEESAALRSLMGKLGFKSEVLVCREPDGQAYADVVKNRFFFYVARA